MSGVQPKGGTSSSRGVRIDLLVQDVLQGRKDSLFAVVRGREPTSIVKAVDSWARSSRDAGDGWTVLETFWRQLASWAAEALVAEPLDETFVAFIIHMVQVLPDVESHSPEHRGRQLMHLKEFCARFLSAILLPVSTGGILTAEGKPNETICACRVRGGHIREAVHLTTILGDGVWFFLHPKVFLKGPEAATQARRNRDELGKDLDKQDVCWFGAQIAKGYLFLAAIDDSFRSGAASKIYSIESVMGAQEFWQLLNEVKATSLLSCAIKEKEFVKNEKFLPSLLRLGQTATGWFCQTMFDELAYVKEDILSAWGLACSKIFQTWKKDEPSRESRQVLKMALEKLFLCCRSTHARLCPSGMSVAEAAYHVLVAFHGSLFRKRQNTELCYELYDPKMWIALDYPNSDCRKICIRLFVKIFPLEMPPREGHGPNAERNTHFDRLAYMAKQVKCLVDAITDTKSEACRVAGCEVS